MSLIDKDRFQEAMKYYIISRHVEDEIIFVVARELSNFVIPISDSEDVTYKCSTNLIIEGGMTSLLFSVGTYDIRNSLRS